MARLRAAYTAKGDLGFWQCSLEQALSRGTPSVWNSDGMAMLYARVHDRERALASLERAYEVHSSDLLFMRVEPMFSKLRDEPRFQAIVRRVGIPS